MTKGYLWLTVIVLAELAVAPISRAQDQAEGKKLYATYCVSCHGEQGKGDGTAAAALPVKPADHTNGTVMNQLSDQFLTDVISKGGAGVGKSILGLQYLTRGLELQEPAVLITDQKPANVIAQAHAIGFTI